MKIKCLGCEALARMIYLCAAHSPHVVDVSLFPLGLHNQPKQLRTTLQNEIDAVSGKDYEYITLAYGLCGQAIAGISARETPIVIPRAHDCITLFLGDRKRYMEQHEQCPGTYWYTKDYIERGMLSGTNIIWGLGSDGNIQSTYEEFVEKYGQENADYLMQVLGNWQSSYKRAVYVDLGTGDGQSVEDIARKEATQNNWIFERMLGDLTLIRRLLAGEWNDDFLIVPAEKQISTVYDDKIINILGETN